MTQSRREESLLAQMKAGPEHCGQEIRESEEEKAQRLVGEQMRARGDGLTEEGGTEKAEIPKRITHHDSRLDLQAEKGRRAGGGCRQNVGARRGGGLNPTCDRRPSQAVRTAFDLVAAIDRGSPTQAQLPTRQRLDGKMKIRR